MSADQGEPLPWDQLIARATQVRAERDEVVALLKSISMLDVNVCGNLEFAIENARALLKTLDQTKP